MAIMAAQMCVGCSRPSPDYYSHRVHRGGGLKRGCYMIRGAEGCNADFLVQYQ